MKQQTIMKRLKGFRSSVSLSSPATGNAVANQTKVIFDNGVLFQSYNSVIAIKKDGKLYVTEDYDYSKTTSKYLNQFCGYTAKEITKELENKNPDIVLLKS